MTQQRSSAARTAGGVAREVTIGDITYLLSQPDKVRRAMDEEMFLLSKRLDILPAIAARCADMPAQEAAAWRHEAIESMMCGIAFVREWQAYYDSLWQWAFRFWNALDISSRPKEITKLGPTKAILDGVRWAYEILDGATKVEMDSIVTAIRTVSQENPLGEPSSSPDDPASRATDIPTTAAGQTSTAS